MQVESPTCMLRLFASCERYPGVARCGPPDDVPVEHCPACDLAAVRSFLAASLVGSSGASA